MPAVQCLTPSSLSSQDDTLCHIAGLVQPGGECTLYTSRVEYPHFLPSGKTGRWKSRPEKHVQEAMKCGCSGEVMLSHHQIRLPQCQWATEGLEEGVAGCLMVVSPYRVSPQGDVCSALNMPAWLSFAVHTPHPTSPSGETGRQYARPKGHARWFFRASRQLNISHVSGTIPLKHT